MGGTTIYRHSPDTVTKALPRVLVGLALIAVVGFVLSPGWVGAALVASLLLQSFFWFGRSRGYVQVSDAGIDVRSQDVGLLRPRHLAWHEVEGVRRPRWSTALVLDLAGGGELTLPALSAEDSEAFVADVERRRQLTDRAGGA